MARVEESRYMDDYPSLYGLLTTSLPALPRLQPHVFRTFVRYTGMSEGDARHALMYASVPIIRVAELHERKYAYYPGSGDVIILHWTFVTDVEAAHTTGFAGALALLESKVLHEMVHWGWHKMTLSRNEPPSKYGLADYAWDFEKDAWGVPQTVYSTGLSHVVPDPLIPRPLESSHR
jgi:hypothetical protein